MNFKKVKNVLRDAFSTVFNVLFFDVFFCFYTFKCFAILRSIFAVYFLYYHLYAEWTSSSHQGMTFKS